MSIANYFTLSRLLISPIFLIVYLEHEFLGIHFLFLPYILIFLLTLLELSDAFDGYLARKYNQVTDLGKILDPMADSISRISIFLAFTEGVIQLPMFYVFVFLYRDSVISTLRTMCALKGVALAARTSGKIKAVVQAVSAYVILILMIPNSLGFLSLSSLRIISKSIVGLACLYAVFSGCEYIYANRDFIRKNLSASKK